MKISSILIAYSSLWPYLLEHIKLTFNIFVLSRMEDLIWDFYPITINCETFCCHARTSLNYFHKGIIDFALVCLLAAGLIIFTACKQAHQFYLYVQCSCIIYQQLCFLETTFCLQPNIYLSCDSKQASFKGSVSVSVSKMSNDNLQQNRQSYSSLAGQVKSVLFI